LVYRAKEQQELNMKLEETDLYISADVETDGPIPGKYSMLSFGLSCVATYDGSEFRRIAADGTTLYKELRPISRAFDPEALAVNGLDRNALKSRGEFPAAAMREAFYWVRSVAGGRRPVVVAYPASFDWMWLYWYFVNFTEEGSPFGFSGCLDIKTMLAIKVGTPLSRASKSQLPPELAPTLLHTHNALDDAKEQGELFANLFTWRPPQ
jgi:hypothetical protein